MARVATVESANATGKVQDLFKIVRRRAGHPEHDAGDGDRSCCARKLPAFQ